MAVHSAQIPVQEHRESKVTKAKKTEEWNLKEYDIFEEVEERNYDMLRVVTSHWIVMKKEGYHGQKIKSKPGQWVSGIGKTPE